MPYQFFFFFFARRGRAQAKQSAVIRNKCVLCVVRVLISLISSDKGSAEKKNKPWWMGNLNSLAFSPILLLPLSSHDQQKKKTRKDPWLELDSSLFPNGTLPLLLVYEGAARFEPQQKNKLQPIPSSPLILPRHLLSQPNFAKPFFILSSLVLLIVL